MIQTIYRPINQQNSNDMRKISKKRVSYFNNDNDDDDNDEQIVPEKLKKKNEIDDNTER